MTTLQKRLRASPTSQIMEEAAARIDALEKQGPISRDIAKRQIAAARALIAIIQTRAMAPARAAFDHQQMADAITRLETETEAMARVVYAPDFKPDQDKS